MRDSNGPARITTPPLTRRGFLAAGGVGLATAGLGLTGCGPADTVLDGRTTLRGSAGIYSARQNMLSQVGSVTTNGVQQQTIFLNSSIIAGGATAPVWPNVVTPTPVPPGQFPPGTGVRVFSRDYANPRVYSTNIGFERELVRDVVLYLEGDPDRGLRVLRSTKNRFGVTHVSGMFEMRSDGLIEVEDPSKLFLDGWESEVPGTVIFPAVEGRRSVLVEIQGLVVPTSQAQPRRSIRGLDPTRVNLIRTAMRLLSSSDLGHLRRKHRHLALSHPLHQLLHLLARVQEA